jgi:hypothetical protein
MFKHRTLFFNDELNNATPLFSVKFQLNIFKIISLFNILFSFILILKQKYSNDSKSISTETLLTTVKYAKKLGMNDFIESGLNDNCQEEYFELKCKYENMKKINEKIYNYAIEKILKS